MKKQVEHTVTLVAAGILAGDGWAQMDRFTDDFAVGAKNPRIEIIFEEVGT